MTRKSILLASGPANFPIQSAGGDLDAIRDYLRSDLGGAWKDSEIISCTNVSRDRVLSEVGGSKDVDYCLVFFVGRGETLKMELPWAETRIFLDSGEAITERELNSGCSHVALILDCQQDAPHTSPRKSMDDSSSIDHTNRESHIFRRLYDEAISSAESGIVKVSVIPSSSGQVNQSLTQHLLNASRTWAKTNAGVLVLGQAVAIAKDTMKLHNAASVPEYKSGRRLHDIPFAVNI